MAQNDEMMMRNALDAVDRGRRLAMVGVGALFVATVFALYALFRLMRRQRAIHFHAQVFEDPLASRDLIVELNHALRQNQPKTDALRLPLRLRQLRQ